MSTRGKKARLIFVTIYLASFIIGWCSAADNFCQDLDIYEHSLTDPVSGEDLPFCATDNLQCCTVDYFASLREEINEQLLVHAQNDLEKTLNIWSIGYQNSLESLEEFIAKLFDYLPFPPSLIHLAIGKLEGLKVLLSQQLHPDSLVDLDYDFSGFMFNVTSCLVDVFTESLKPHYPDASVQCLNSLIRNNISPDALLKIGEDLKQVQLLYQTLKKLDTFLEDLYVQESFGYTPQEQCIGAVVSQRCLSCQRNVPSLCSGVCTNVIIGCQSPLNDGLLAQFEGLWQISREVMRSTLSIMNKTLRVDEPMILTAQSLVQNIIPLSASTCHINLVPIIFSNGNVDNSEILLPESLSFAVSIMSSLSGVFQYGDFIPSYCVSHALTSSCWDGNAHVVNETSIQPIGPSIANQSQNPAYQFNTNHLYQQAGSLNTPVTDFLISSAFNSTLPKGIVVPHIDPLPTPTSVTMTTTTMVTMPATTSTPFNKATPIDDRVDMLFSSSPSAHTTSLLVTVVVTIMAVSLVNLL